MARCCIDASVVVAWLVPDQRSKEVRAFWARHLEGGDDLLCPPLLYPETVSAVRYLVYRGILEPHEGAQAVDDLVTLDIAVRSSPELHRRAYHLAQHLGRARSYDTYYLALAELEQCELWTADVRLYNSIAPIFPWVHLVQQ